MSCAELLLELRNLGARVWLEDDRLRVAAPQGALTNEIRRELKDRRSELLEWQPCRMRLRSIIFQPRLDYLAQHVNHKLVRFLDSCC